MERQRAQEKATFDHILGQLIALGVGKAFGSVKNEYPDIASVYPTLFDSKEIEQKKQEKKAELSALRFKQFAESFNRNFNKEGKED